MVQTAPIVRLRAKVDVEEKGHGVTPLVADPAPTLAGVLLMPQTRVAQADRLQVHLSEHVVLVAGEEPVYIAIGSQV
jgi:hypothetical protein